MVEEGSGRLHDQAFILQPSSFILNFLAEACRNRTYLSLLSQAHQTVLKTAPFTRTDAPPRLKVTYPTRRTCGVSSGTLTAVTSDQQRSAFSKQHSAKNTKADR